MTLRSPLSLVLSGVLLLAASGAHAKCTVTLKFVNNDTHAITVLGNQSQSRINGLTWAKMSFSNVSLDPGATGTASWTTNQACSGNAKRDLRFFFNDESDGVNYSTVFDNRDIDDGLTYTFALKKH